MEARARRPAVAGQFYEADGAALAHEVEGCFLSDRGPGELPTRHRADRRSLRAAVVPHAGLRYSGAIAARAYARLAADRPPATVLVLGVDHHGLGGGSAVSDVDWETPFGPVAVDHALVGALAEPPIVVDEAAHALEHSIEVQLPFLQYIEPKTRLAALQVRHGPLSELAEVAERVRAAIRGKDVLLVASTDLSHYVPAETARRLDRLALDRIEAVDPEGLYETVRRERISMCGIAPTTVLLEVLRGEAVIPRLLAWGHSGEVEPMTKVVGYASFVFEATGEPPPPPRRSEDPTLL
ncbi:MAG TPA: AmmeMemoRadiSam system protein B [Thermoplasmata archaeon]|nr:AmmeMemoRadiSam system protein B [Thermoplasmata archaeon]